MSAEDHKSTADGASKSGAAGGRGLGEAERAEIRQRSSELGRRLDEARGPGSQEGPGGSRQSALGQGFKMAIDLVAGVAIGFGIGWALDNAFNTRPIFMIVFIILGFAAGMLNLIRTALRLQATAEPMQRSAPSVKDDDDEDDRR